MNMNIETHWEQVYSTKAHDAVSWFAPHLETSLQQIRACGLPLNAPLIDVGAGESTLVDDLLDEGWTDLTLLDISSTALSVTRNRLGERTRHVQWMIADILQAQLPPQHYALWHDRAVFHFLTEPAQRERYVAQVLHALRPGGFVVMGTFGANGPSQCSNLDVARYSAQELHGVFGPEFELLGSTQERHRTPWGAEQEFTYCFCRRQAAPDIQTTQRYGS